MRKGIAFVEFDTEELAVPAKDALNDFRYFFYLDDHFLIFLIFRINPDQNMKVDFAKK